VPIVIGKDVAAENARPERAFGMQVSRVEDDHLTHHVHARTLREGCSLVDRSHQRGFHHPATCTPQPAPPGSAGTAGPPTQVADAPESPRPCSLRELPGTRHAACEYVPLFGGQRTEYRPRWTLAEHGQDVSAVLVPIREFIADVPAPGGDHSKHEPPALREQNLIDVRIACADLLWHVRNIKLGGSPAAGFEVDEPQAVTGIEEVARMRFAMQQLLGSTAAVDPSTRALQRAEEEMPVGLGERGGFVSVDNKPFSLCDPVQEVRGGDLSASHAGMQALEHVCVCTWEVQPRSHDLVVGPQGHGEAVAFVDPRLNPGLQRCDGARGPSESQSELNLKRGYLLSCQCYPGEDVTRQQAYSELVGILNHDCVVNPQMQLSGQCCRRGYRTCNELRFHNVDLRTYSLLGVNECAEPIGERMSVAAQRHDSSGADALLRDEGERESSAIVTPSGRVPLWSGSARVPFQRWLCINMRPPPACRVWAGW
jgi:hypothetical protein